MTDKVAVIAIPRPLSPEHMIYLYNMVDRHNESLPDPFFNLEMVEDEEGGDGLYLIRPNAGYYWARHRYTENLEVMKSELIAQDIGYHDFTFVRVIFKAMDTLSYNGNLRIFKSPECDSYELDIRKVDVHLPIPGIRPKLKRILLTGEHNSLRSVRRWLKWNIIHNRGRLCQNVIHEAMKRMGSSSVHFITEDGFVARLTKQGINMVFANPQATAVRMTALANGLEEDILVKGLRRTESPPHAPMWTVMHDVYSYNQAFAM
ncbi:hypothetical protein AVT69_gp343 [Pseudomonas phage PhiPA3]|uniref:Uncharacterized protein 345 n=1 Tax=Pseudomonas phage PhiPA3 TaxID=998086 RepID=F8SJI0_BPPA3|nr:hypothetical protein AVT69_gp343 [Pseudomonas phage PhiPA3]AEH03768.1 hypothetical protein [Pseudomonas phage PhiPA3]